MTLRICLLTSGKKSFGLRGASLALPSPLYESNRGLFRPEIPGFCGFPGLTGVDIPGMDGLREMSLCTLPHMGCTILAELEYEPGSGCRLCTGCPGGENRVPFDGRSLNGPADEKLRGELRAEYAPERKEKRYDQVRKSENRGLSSPEAVGKIHCL